MSETETLSRFRPLIREDMTKFLTGNLGRPVFSDEVRGKSESLIAATEEVRDYLHSGKVDIIQLSKMMDYVGDVYDQAVGFAVMSREYPSGELDQATIG